MDDKKSSIGSSAAVSKIAEADAKVDIPDGQNAEFIEGLIKSYSSLQVRDIEQQLEWRPKVLKFTAKGLVWQNIIVFGLVAAGMFTGHLSDLKLVLSTLVGGTLLQSAYIARIMVKFLFSDIDYHDKEYTKWLRLRKNSKK